MQYNIFKEKSRETCKERYGTEVVLQLNDVKEKGKQTLPFDRRSFKILWLSFSIYLVYSKKTQSGRN